jgi:hypothetical protein
MTRFGNRKEAQPYRAFWRVTSCECLDELTMDRTDVTFLHCPRHCGEHCHENYPTGAGDCVLDVG